MEPAPVQLHSERHGRPRRLSANDLNLLVFKRIARARDFHGLFRGSLQPYQGLEQYETPARFPDAEAYFTERLRVSGLGRTVFEDDELRKTFRTLADARAWRAGDPVGPQ